MTIRARSALTALCAALLSALAFAQAPIRSGSPGAEPARGSRAGSERWIVHFATRPFTLDALRAEYRGRADPARVAELVADVESRMKDHQAAFVAKVEQLGGSVVAQFWLVDACTIEIDPESLPAIRELENVAFLQPDALCAPHAPIKTATDGNNHHADQLQAAGVTGAGLAIAICDSGADSNMNGTGKPHIAYSDGGSTTATRLLFNKKIGAASADDVSGHGTAVASCAAGWKWNTATADQGHAFGAKLAVYAMADFANGNAFTTTQTAAWQAVVADAAANKIKVGNMSYGGFNDPLDATQQAIDAAASVADLLICTSAGNSGADISISSVTLNGLAVGAVNAGTHTLAGFSGTGFMASGGTFPDLVANGVAVAMAQRDNEAADNLNSGTSFASPMVAGAAALVRAANPALTALETKAILLASTEASPGSSLQQVAGVGCGYLRDDVAHQIAMNPHSYGRALVSTAAPVCSWQLRVKKSQVVQVAIAWHRIDTTKADFSDLNLFLKRGATTLVGAASGPNTEEFVRFTATADEVLTVEVRAFAVRNVPQQEFAWATNVDNGAKTFTAALSGPGFGLAIGSAGDFNKDGYEDFVIGHPGATIGANLNAGVLHVVSGKDYASLTGGGLPGAAQGQRAGASVAAGDIDQDGWSDVVYGFPGITGIGSGINLLSGRTVLASTFASSPSPGLGELLATARYLDADGVPDVVATDNGSFDLVAFSGRTKQQLWRVTPVAGIAIRALATLGDIDGDGLDDVIVGLPAFGSNLGRMEIRSGKNGALLRSRDGQVAGERLGSSVGRVGDLDGDGVDDYMFGSPEHPNGGTKRGNCAAQSGRTGTFLHILFGSFDNEGLGFQVGSAGGDVDGDGTPDFLVSAVQAGRVRVHSGKDAHVIQTLTGQGLTFGAVIAALNSSGDDQPDFLVSDPGFATVSLFDSPAVASPVAVGEYGVPCAGAVTGFPRCGFAGAPPRVGRSCTVTLASAPKSAAAACQLAAAPSALDLTSIGLAGCQLLVAAPINVNATTTALGQASLTLPIPFTPALIGAPVHFQWLAVAAGKTPLPIALSTGGVIRIGGQL